MEVEVIIINAFGHVKESESKSKSYFSKTSLVEKMASAKVQLAKEIGIGKEYQIKLALKADIFAPKFLKDFDKQVDKMEAMNAQLIVKCGEGEEADEALFEDPDGCYKELLKLEYHKILVSRPNNKSTAKPYIHN